MKKAVAEVRSKIKCTKELKDKGRGPLNPKDRSNLI